MKELIKPDKEKHHPATAIMLNFLNNKVGMKKLDEWRVFFKKYSDKDNELAGKLLSAAEKIIQGETVEELDFVCLVWMLLRFHKDDEIKKEKAWIEKEKGKLKK